MEDPEKTRRFEAALGAPRPAEALYALATALKSEGMSKETIYDFFMEFFRRHRSDTDERLFDAIADTMDFIAHDRL
jgi:hypothetical protein